MYLEWRPGIALAPHIEKLWYCEGYVSAHRRERVLPNGRFQLIVDLAAGAGSAIVMGLSTNYNVLETANLQRVIGAVFRPGGARVFFDPPADEFRDRAAALEDVWSTASGRMCERLLDAAGPAARLRVLEAELEARLRPVEWHSAVRYALGEFGRRPDTASILGVARDIGLSRRRLAGLFREQVGLTPKLYCRLHRFRHVVRRIAAGDEIDWVQVALEGGYYDQAHMAHEFREFAGVSPGSWRASDRPFLNHAVID